MQPVLALLFDQLRMQHRDSVSRELSEKNKITEDSKIKHFDRGRDIVSLRKIQRILYYKTMPIYRKFDNKTFFSGR